MRKTLENKANLQLGAPRNRTLTTCRYTPRVPLSV
jgi:hypothetical protein